MKVICIENDLITLPDAPDEMVYVGKIYTVKELVNWYGIDWYILNGFNSGWGWNINCFIPLSNINERRIKLTAYDEIK